MGSKRDRNLEKQRKALSRSSRVHAKIAAGHIRASWKKRMLAADKRKRCPACDQSYNKTNRRPTVDHIVPLSRGGLDVECNWQLMCEMCNKKKGNRLTSEMSRSSC